MNGFVGEKRLLEPDSERRGEDATRVAGNANYKTWIDAELIARWSHLSKRDNRLSASIVCHVIFTRSIYGCTALCAVTLLLAMLNDGRGT